GGRALRLVVRAADGAAAAALGHAGRTGPDERADHAVPLRRALRRQAPRAPLGGAAPPRRSAVGARRHGGARLRGGDAARLGLEEEPRRGGVGRGRGRAPSRPRRSGGTSGRDRALRRPGLAAARTAGLAGGGGTGGGHGGRLPGPGEGGGGALAGALERRGRPGVPRRHPAHERGADAGAQEAGGDRRWRDGRPASLLRSLLAVRPAHRRVALRVGTLSSSTSPRLRFRNVDVAVIVVDVVVIVDGDGDVAVIERRS